MSDDLKGQERTEPATPKRREKARQDGQVARSTEIASVIVLVVSVIGLVTYGNRMVEIVAGDLTATFSSFGALRLDVAVVHAMGADVVRTMGMILLPFMALVAVAGLSSHLAQVGVLITTKPLEPKFNRMSPATGLKRIFSKRGGMELVKSLIKLVIVGAIVTWSLVRATEHLLPIMTIGLMAAYKSILVAMLEMTAAGAFALGLLAILDFFFQRYDFENQIKMTRQEIKEEMKQNEGDPQLKAKVRARQQEISRRRMMEDVRTADVVVTNPIRFAVALKYDPARMSAPKVVAKGARLLAKRIRDIARESGIPVIQDPPLARALYKGCKVGSDIPLDLYKTVAELLAFVYRKREPAGAGGAR